MAKTMQEVEKDVLRERLQEFNGNKARTAKSLNLTRPLLYRKLQRYGLYKPKA